MNDVAAELIKDLPQKIDVMIYEEVVKMLKENGFSDITDEIKKIRDSCNKDLYFGKGQGIISLSNNSYMRFFVFTKDRKNYFSVDVDTDYSSCMKKFIKAKF